MPNRLEELLINQVLSNGGSTFRPSLVVAPGFGGDYKSEGLAVRKDGLLAELGKYSNQTGGENYYGYAGYQPITIGPVRIGGALGGYGQDPTAGVNKLAGLLATMQIRNGEASLMLSPSLGAQDPAIFLGYKKRF